MKLLLVFLVVAVAVALCADFCGPHNPCKCPHGQTAMCSADGVCHCHHQGHVRAVVNCTQSSDCHGQDAHMHHCDHGHHKECMNGECKCTGHH